MQINLSIQLEPDELAMLIKLLGAAPLAPQPNEYPQGNSLSMLRRGPGGAVAAETAPDAPRGVNIPAPTETPVLAPVAPATDEAGTTLDPLATLATANGLAPLGEWTPVAEAAAHPPVTTHRRAGRPSKQPPAKRPALMPGEEEPSAPGRLPFDQFDKLVRSEMKRLSMDGRMPNHRLWNDERNVLLPTMTGVMLRYGCNNLIDLAAKLDMLPPLSALGSNGVKVAAP